MNNTKTHLEGQAHIKTGMGEQERTLKFIEVDSINIISNPRSETSEDAFKALCESVKRFGVTTPVLVSESATEGRYDLIAGGRRYMAAKEVGLSTIPAQITTAAEAATDSDRLSRAIVENLVREDMTPIDEALAFAELQRSEALTEKGVAELLSVPVSKVKDRLGLLNLPTTVQEMVDKAEITLQNAATLRPIANHSPRIAEALATRVVNGAQSPRGLDDDPAAALRALADMEITPGDTDEDLFVLPFGEKDSVNVHEVADRLDRVALADVLPEKDRGPVLDTVRDVRKVMETIDRELAVIVVTETDVDQARAYGALIEYSQGAHKRSGVLTDPVFAADWLERSVNAAFKDVTPEQASQQAKEVVETQVDAIQNEKQRRKEEREIANISNKHFGDRLRRDFDFKSELTMEMATAICGLLLDSYGKDIGRAIGTVRSDFEVVDSSVSMSGGKKRVTTRLPGPDEALEKINQRLLEATSPEQMIARTFGFIAGAVFADRRALPESRRGQQFPLPVITNTGDSVAGNVAASLWDEVAPMLTKERAAELEDVFVPSTEGRPTRNRLARNEAIDLEAANTDQQMIGESDDLLDLIDDEDTENDNGTYLEGEYPEDTGELDGTQGGPLDTIEDTENI